MKNLRDWWDSLDDIWRRIMILNLGVEHKMGGVKNYINDYQWNYKKIESLYEEGTLDNYIITESEITDDTIKKIVNLKALMIERAGITDLTPLAKLERLEILICPFNKIINIEPLKDLFNLQELNLAFNNITSVAPLKNLKKLRKLELLRNNILSIEPIVNLENLEEISCSWNWDSNLTTDLTIQLSNKWKKLRKLAAPHISDTQNLAEFYPDLESLFIQGFDVDLSDIIKLKRLKVLRIDRSNINNLDPLVELTNLTTLMCNTTRIESIEPLSYLHNLERLECYCNKIVDLSPLRKLKKLKILYSGDNKIECLKPLEDLTELQHLICSNNKISSLEPLKNLTKLRRLFCRGNPIPLKEIEMLKVALPNCEVIFQEP